MKKLKIVILIIAMLSVSQIQRIGKAIALYQPLGYEQAMFHKTNVSFKWIFGGNRSSKTYTNMMDLSMFLMDCHPTHYRPKGTHWACIEHWDQVRDILWEEKLQKFMPPNAIAPGGIEYGQHKIPKRVFFRNGHRLEFKSFFQGRGSFQGRAVDSIHCDEQCEYDFQGILNEMQARLLDKNGFLSWSMTPILSQPELEERILSLPDTDEVFKINLNDNRMSRGGYIPDKRIDDMIAQWPEETQATRIAGEFASFFGSVFKTYKRQTHVIDPFRIPKDWRRYRGFDFGFTNPFVCLWLAKDKDENWYVYREYYQAQTMIEEHIRNVKLFSKGETFVENWADPEDPEARTKLRQAGIKTRIARKDIQPSIEVMQSKFKVKENGKPSLYIFKNCKNTTREIAGYHYPKGTSTNNPKDVPVQKNDHTVDVLRYILYNEEGKFKKGSVYASA